MRTISAFLFLLAACSSSPSGDDAGPDATTDATSEASSDAGADAADVVTDAGDASVACTQTVSGDETATLSCIESLCHPTNGTTEIIDTSTGGHIIRPAVMGTFAVGTYTGAQLDVASTFDVKANGKQYVARGGASPYAGQSVTVSLTTVVQPSNGPCDGVIHGTSDVTLVELVDGGVGPGHVDVHVVF